LKLGDIKGALMDTEFAMREGNNNAKALFRQGQVGIEDFELVFNVFCFSF
jgi:peptidyl-prolyl isomerase D